MTMYKGAGAVHPRGHGEHSVVDLYGNMDSGSSPWARGTLTIHGLDKQVTRFIPVGTGNTLDDSDPAITTAVHPRGHGEHCKE